MSKGIIDPKFPNVVGKVLVEIRMDDEGNVGMDLKPGADANAVCKGLVQAVVELIFQAILSMSSQSNIVKPPPGTQFRG